MIAQQKYKFIHNDPSRRYFTTVSRIRQLEHPSQTRLPNLAFLLYYNNYTGGYSDEWVERVYAGTIETMNRVLNGSSIYVDDKSLNGSDAWKYIYDQLTQCGDYRDAQTMLDAFVIVNSKESGTTITTVDNLGNENTRNRNQYYYDSHGRLIRGSGTLLEMMLFGRYYTSGSTFYFDYAESCNRL